jgi:ABC-2 type transport system permease protein
MTEIVPRYWFNPNLIYQWFMVPNLIANIALLIGLIVTALSIARERELGTFDQLMVSPLRTHEIVIGKLTPPMLIGLFHMTVYILAAIFIFAVPLRGSLVLLYASSLFLGAFLFLVPATLLSGFATPIENMPNWLQPITVINPMRYFLVIVKGIFLKDIPLSEVLRQTLPLFAIALVTLGAASWLFRRRLE